MPCPFQSLPQRLLDEILHTTFLVAPSVRSSFLSSLGTCLHASAVRVLFRTISIQDNALMLVESQASPSAAVLNNPERYASSVKTFVVADPVLPEDGESLLNAQPIDADLLFRLLRLCADIETLIWESSFPPPDGLCEVLAAGNPRLCKIAFEPPPMAQPQRCNLAKWDAPSLPLLSCLAGLTSLRLCRLTQAGARAFATFLEKLGDESMLESLNIDFLWLDDQLCNKIVSAGRKIQKLCLSTSGTKLSDKGIVTILEGCELLEELVLDEVEGRLSRTLWTKPSCFPVSLKALRIVFAENGPHHSWATDHLESLYAIPLGLLDSLEVLRREAPPSLQSGVAMYDATLDDCAPAKSIPAAFLEQMKQSSRLATFRCDFWCLSISEVKSLLESSTRLEHIQICVDAPFSKLLSLTSTFASLSSLRTLSISITSAHAPGKPLAFNPPLSPSSSFPTSLPTPSASPTLKTKSLLPQLLDLDRIQIQPESLGDSLPLLREIKRFVRKCPRLEIIEWYGKHGRGTWVITRPTSSKTSVNVAVEHAAPRLSETMWKVIARDRSIEDATKRGWGGFADIERAGHAWTGDTAEAFARERLAAEKEKEEMAALSSPVERAGKSGESVKRARVPSVSISSSSGSDFLLPVTPTTSPTQHTPLTPPLSDLSMSETDATVLRHDEASNRKRSPSTPNRQTGGGPRHRTRTGSAVASTSKDSVADSAHTSHNPSSRGSKSHRGRGGNTDSNTRGPRKPSGNNNAETSSGRSRGGRGPRTSNVDSIRPRRSTTGST
ncbi:hypothetical protein R3P38DRAFT_2840650 [Favolaschia claudopus]|uniref:Uncharacterized protein n=1 Tax=Favolaschia claudopus TaxID=2862362 RepID=A0AAW0DZ68_9AGAR